MHKMEELKVHNRHVMFENSKNTTETAKKFTVQIFKLSLLTTKSLFGWLVCWLGDWSVGWVLWHINLCRLSKAKSIFMQIISSISNKSV